MNILQEIIQARNGQIVKKLASQFGLDEKQANKALSNLIPAVAGGIKKTAQSTSDLESLISKALSNQELRKSVEIQDLLAEPKATQATNEMLGDIVGSKHLSRNIATQSAQSAGIELRILKKMLPLVSGLVRSTLNKHGESNNPGLGALLSSLLGNKQDRPAVVDESGFESLLDFDGDRNVSDDVMHLVKKCFETHYSGLPC